MPLATQALVFDRLFAYAERTFHPDLIVTACTTMSAVKTTIPFCRENRHIHGAVEQGIRMSVAALAARPDARLLYLAARSSFDTDVFARQLKDAGHGHPACIGSDWSVLTRAVEFVLPDRESQVRQLARDTVRALPDSAAPLIGLLACANYDFVMPMIERTFCDEGVCVARWLNPFAAMLEPLWPLVAHRPEPTARDVTAEIVSPVELFPAEARSLIIPPSLREDFADAFLRDCPLAHGALLHYRYVPEAFAWRDVVPTPAT
ncbi:MAG: hypothetical protein HY543_08035 [Deltaproteobacteria bacterium]|nr:hypothetical protein [Deltaproteobacteria bacterium]